MNPSNCNIYKVKYFCGGKQMQVNGIATSIQTLELTISLEKNFDGRFIVEFGVE
jgi:hypothetical protein